jgi:hypothetical protein
MIPLKKRIAKNAQFDSSFTEAIDLINQSSLFMLLKTLVLMI